MNKKLKIVLIVFLTLASLAIIGILGVFIFLSNYNYVCYRETYYENHSYNYSFNINGSVKKLIVETRIFFESKEAAEKYYSTSPNKSHIRVDGKDIVFGGETILYEYGNKLSGLKESHEAFNYTCEWRKK